LGPAELRYVLQSPGLVENCVGLYVPLLEFNHYANSVSTLIKISAIGYTPVFDTTPIRMLLAIFIARAVVRNGRMRTNAGLE
jgi:hypothetical protein